MVLDAVAGAVGGRDRVLTNGVMAVGATALAAGVGIYLYKCDSSKEMQTKKSDDGGPGVGKKPLTFKANDKMTSNRFDPTAARAGAHGILLLDVRTQGEWDHEGRIEGAGVVSLIDVQDVLRMRSARSVGTAMVAQGVDVLDGVDLETLQNVPICTY